MQVPDCTYIPQNSLPPQVGEGSAYGQIYRVIKAALPALALIRPLGFGLSLSVGVVRLAAEGSKLTKTAEFSQIAKTAIAAAGVAGTVFAHPLGLLIASGNELFVEGVSLVQSLQKGAYGDALKELLHACNDLLYMTLILEGGVQVMAASLALQCLSGLVRACKQYREGQQLEGGFQLLASLVRGHQAIRQIQQYLIEEEIKKCKEEERPYLPLVNGVQKALVIAAYRCNSWMRWTIDRIGYLALRPIDPTNSSQEIWQRVQTAAKVTFALPLATALFAVSAPLYLAASYAGTGRFEKFSAQISKEKTGDSLSLMFQNICGQNPWSTFSGGVTPPLVPGPDGSNRADAILKAITDANPDVFCGQEFDDLDTTRFFAHELAKRGYEVICDLGADDPICNHSGLFIAVSSAYSFDRASFYPFAKEDKTGLMNWTNRGTFAAVLDSDGQKLQIVNLHLNCGSTPQDQEARLTQLQKYVVPLFGDVPTIAVGDSNLDTSQLTLDQKQRAGIDGLSNAYEGRVTCTDEGKHLLNGKSRDGCDECAERIDVALYDPGQMSVSDAKIEFGNSDHASLSFAVVFNQS